MGGPAPQLAPYVEKALGLPCRVPPHYDVANAVGAAVARVTAQVTLQADTERGTVIIPKPGWNIKSIVVLIWTRPSTWPVKPFAGKP